MPQTSTGEVRTITLQAAADLSGKQYHIMRVSAAGACNMASQAAHMHNLGVLLNKPAASGRAAEIAVSGEVKVVAGGAITAPDLLTTNGSGRAAAAASGQAVIGIALTSALADGETIRAMIFPPYFNGNVA